MLVKFKISEMETKNLTGPEYVLINPEQVIVVLESDSENVSIIHLNNIESGISVCGSLSEVAEALDPD